MLSLCFSALDGNFFSIHLFKHLSSTRWVFSVLQQVPLLREVLNISSAFLNLPVVSFHVLLPSVPHTEEPLDGCQISPGCHPVCPCLRNTFPWKVRAAVPFQPSQKLQPFSGCVCFGCSKVSSPFNRWQMHYPAQTGSPYDGVEGQNRWHMSHSHSRRRRWKHAPALASCWRLLAKDNWELCLALSPYSLPGETGIAAEVFTWCIQSNPGEDWGLWRAPGKNTAQKQPNSLCDVRALNPPQGHQISVLLQGIKLPCCTFSTCFAICFNSLCLAALGMLPVFFSLFFPPSHNPSMGKWILYANSHHWNTMNYTSRSRRHWLCSCQERSSTYWKQWLFALCKLDFCHEQY